ncbi:MAG: hypothetical protein JOY82_14220 [Streptosporangiaceae bacterium]|nr:hypothetical protein [Streptosporangiaceae bacterium]MBV9855644.1 hypothetical protein [Streptosporangiaceae bacterium]
MTPGRPDSPDRPDSPETPGRPGSPHRDGDYHLRLAEDAWDNTLRHWHDDMASDFAVRHWAPLYEESRSFLAALRELADVLDAAEHDTGY